MWKKTALRVCSLTEERDDAELYIRACTVFLYRRTIFELTEKVNSLSWYILTRYVKIVLKYYLVLIVWKSVQLFS